MNSSGDENIGKLLRAAVDKRAREEDSGFGWKNSLLLLDRKVFVSHVLGLHCVPRRSRHGKTVQKVVIKKQNSYGPMTLRRMNLGRDANIPLSIFGQFFKLRIRMAHGPLLSLVVTLSSDHIKVLDRFFTP